MTESSTDKIFFGAATFKKVTIIMSAILSLFYEQQRVTWRGDDNANLTATEYVV